MNIIFLEAATPLTKTYSKSSGIVTKTPYPFVWEFTSHEETFTTLAQLEGLLKKHAAKGHCALKGTIARPLVKESRAGSTSTNDTTEWLVLDLDGLPETAEHNGKKTPLTIELLLDMLGIGDISYIVQWSASYGIENKKLRAHVFMLLDRQRTAPLLKQWLIQKNHETPMLREAMTLTKTGNAISWPLDISACQNDKLIYIAPPTLKNIQDPMGKQPRIQLVKKKRDVLALQGTINTTAKNRQLTDTRLAELRDEAGLPARKAKYKFVGTQEVMLSPDEAVITEMKTERGFVYFNLNGGDSWAYYHPENNPDYILNFKGEPTYLTKELLPDYWQQLTGTGSSTRTSSSGLLYLAFCDKRTGVYWRGTYEAATDNLDIYPARNETQLRHFAKQHGVPMGDFIPEWDLVFDPADLVRVDPQNQLVNRFQPTSYMLNVANKAPKKIPPTIARILSHALGDDQAIIDHFINWLAVIVQHRTRTLTAWVLHGTPGTGKGLLTNNILRPLFGAHTAVRNMTELSEKYNHYMEGTFLVFVDEVQTRALRDEASIMAKLKNWITEPTISVRAMYAGSAEVANYSNWIFMSNKPDPVQIDKSDRRYNVAKYQKERLFITTEEIARIEDELQSFYDYLANIPCSIDQAAQIIETEDRDNMIAATESAADTVADALRAGNFEFFIDQLPDDDSHKRNALMMNRVTDYTLTLRTLAARTDPKDGKCNISRDEMRTLFDYCVGDMPQSPNKFTSFLKHRRIHLNVVWVDKKSARGLQVVWQDVAKFGAYNQVLSPVSLVPPTTPKVVPVKTKAKLKKAAV